jgi:hypothetical protein
MKKIFLILVLLLNAALMNGQTLSAARSTDWTLAGLRDTVSPSNIIMFPGDNTGATDVSVALQTAITNAPANSVVQLKAGEYKILDEIELKSFVTLRGMGAGKTILKFDLGGGGGNCLSAFGSEGSDLSLVSAASKEDTSILLSDASSINVGDYVRFIQDDALLVNDSWAERRTGQVSQVADKSGNNITLASPLRMDFPLSNNPRVKRMTPDENIGVECLTINRIDQVTVSGDRNKSSKIKLNRVVNSWVKGVESLNCNYAHFEALYSANLLVSGCYFHDAFEYGTGGRAYGSMLHFATSESKVENTIFDNLRHAMIVQAGANGNVFAYNSSINARGQSVSSQEEDMVCHGNYAYLNLFESNVCEAPTVDGSHGENGPYNTYFRNRATNSGFNVTSYNILGFVLNNSNQNFLGNEGANSINGSGHQETLNSWQSAIGTLETSLAYSAKPDFLNASEYGEIGYDNFGVLASNPSTDRYASGDYINTSCGYYVWEGSSWRDNFVPDIDSENYNARIWDGSVCMVSANTELKTVEIEPGGRLELSTSNTLDLDTIWLKSNASSYSQFKGDASFPTIYEMTISNPGWHLVSVPLTSGTISQAEEELRINYAGNSNGASIYSWDAATAVYNPFLNNLENVSSRAFNVFVDDAFVKTGKGINKNGMLPVKLTFKGIGNNDGITNSTMGYATAGNALGDPNGWNLIFNPYPCSIDLDVVFGTPEPHYQIGTHLYDASLDAFEIRTTTTVNNGNATTIAPGQSFFVKVDALADLNAGYFDFDNTVKTLAATPSFLKSNTPGFNLVISRNGLELSKLTGYLDQHRDAKYLSKKDISGNWSDSSKAILAITRNGHNGTHLLSISAIDYETEMLPVSIYVPVSGNYSIGLASKSLDKEIYLKDKGLNAVQDLGNEIQVNLEKGWTNNQFELVFRDQKLDSEKILSKYSYNKGVLSITYSDDLKFMSKVRISSIAGKQVFESDLFDSKGEHQFEIGFISSGVYLLQILEFGEWKSSKFIIN